MGHLRIVPAACAATDCDSVRLTTLAEGERGRVTCLETPGARGAAKLAAMGVLPGTDLVLVQSFPAVVVRIGCTEFAVDDALAALIRLRRD